jgi:hypothetical protein
MNCRTIESVKGYMGIEPAICLPQRYCSGGMKVEDNVMLQLCREIT